METFAGYIDLKDNSEWQEIYSSQLYDTFFGIFAIFTCDGSSKNDSYILSKMKLTIINYKGVCDLGITDVEINATSDSSKFILKIEVQALNGSTTCDLDCNDLKIPRNKAEILVDRRVKKMHSNGSALSNGLFDNEFYYREGIADDNGNLPFPKRTPIPLVWSDDLPKEILEEFINPSLGVGGSKCPRRRIKVL
ncbi:hypothetical protein [Maribacter forsetii]|uniref:hypothetical protein n=1 Tax=Maribacter forsetii TaxID=444515 RepID=UPI00055E5215|nr:hypothetical protein [Maribacter forsetii]